MKKGRIILLIAGIFCIIPGSLGVILTISSLRNNLAEDSTNDMATSAIVLSHFGNQLFICSILILVLGILLIRKRNAERWGGIFVALGIFLFVLAAVFVVFIMANGVFGVVVLWVVPILMIIGGSLQKSHPDRKR